MTKTLAPLPIGMLIAAAVVYGLVFQFNKLAAGAGATYLGHAFWQTVVAGAVLCAIALARGQTVSFRWPYLRAYLVVGATGFGLPMALVTLVSTELPTGLVSLAFALSPTFTYFASVTLRLDKLSSFGMAGIALGFAGVAIVLWPAAALPGEGAAGWFLLTLIIPVSLAITNVSAAVLRPPDTTSTVMGAGFLLGAAAILLPLMIVTGQVYVPSNADTLVPTLGAAAVNGVFIILFAEIVRRWGPTFFAQFNYLMVVAAIGWAFVFFSEIPNLYTWIALALMAAGVVVSEMRHGREPTNDEGSP
jgi:drug/metabolite transporter (DMT)-like permease